MENILEIRNLVTSFASDGRKDRAIAVNGVLNLAQALELRKQGGSWLGPVIMAALTVVAGLFLVFFSFGAMKAAVMVIGGVIVYNGVSNLLIESKYRKTGR